MTPPAAPDPKLRSLFQEIILDHYRRPRNRGEPSGPAPSVRKSNPTCGDEITLQLEIENEEITGGRFSGYGCSVSQASASMMTELVRGKTRAEARELSRRFREMLHGSEEAATDRALGDLRSLAGVARFPTRVRCAMLCWEALEDVMTEKSEE